MSNCYVDNLFSYCKLHSSSIKHKKVTFISKNINSKWEKKVSIEIISSVGVVDLLQESVYYMKQNEFTDLLQEIQLRPSSSELRPFSSERKLKYCDNDEEISKILSYIFQISQSKINNEFATLIEDTASNVREVNSVVNYYSPEPSTDIHMDIDNFLSQGNAEEFMEPRCFEGTIINSRPSSSEFDIQAGFLSSEDENNSNFSQNNIQGANFYVKIHIKNVEKRLSDFINIKGMEYPKKRTRYDLSLEVENFWPIGLLSIDLGGIIITSRLKIIYEDASTRDSENFESFELERNKAGAIIQYLLKKNIIEKIQKENAFQIKDTAVFETEVFTISAQV